MLRATQCRRTAEILSGVALSAEIRRRVALGAQTLSRPPCLAVVLVGDRPDSHRYIKHKKQAALECGIDFRLVQLPETISQQGLHKELVAVNSDHGVDGVLLQLPLPPHLRARSALFHIHPGKDVDGLHPLNAGNLFLRDSSPLADVFAASARVPPDSATAAASRTASPHAVDESLVVATHEGAFSSVTRRSHERQYFIPCTALAVRSLIVSYLNRTGSFFRGGPPPQRAREHLHAVIVNSSMVVGVPTTALLQKERGFTVTMCNRSTPLPALQQLTRTADVLVTAYGEANVFDATFVKKGAIVVDVAINERHDDRAANSSPTLCGDVDFASVKEVARAMTPVPGGVGPLTVAHLMQNVLKAAWLRHDTRLYYNSVYTSFVKMYGATHPTVPQTAPEQLVKRTAAAAAGAVAGDSSAPGGGAAAEGDDDDDDHAGDDFTDNDNFNC